MVVVATKGCETQTWKLRVWFVATRKMAVRGRRDERVRMATDPFSALGRRDEQKVLGKLVATKNEDF